MLTPEQRRGWFADGMLHLPSFFEEREVDAVVEVHERAWRERRDDVSIDDLETGTRSRISDVPSSMAGGPFKLNDLYLVYPPVLELGLHPRLLGVLEQLLGDRVVLINSLDVDHGTGQPFHVDALYMTPPTPYNLIAAWVALEDVHPDAGPLQYYPGSHMISPYRFSTGDGHVVVEEMDHWWAYMDQQVRALGLQPRTFLPRRCDLLVWHSYLLHGGAHIEDAGHTRRSSVFHYFSESATRLRYGPREERTKEFELKPYNGGFYMEKPPPFAGEKESASERRDPRERPIRGFLEATLCHLREWRRGVFG